MKKILVNGARGQMGQVTVRAIETSDSFQLVGTGTSQDNLTHLIEKHRPDIVIDFTTPDCVFENTQAIISCNVHPVIGTTGLTSEQLTEIQIRCTEQKLGGIYAPNFSIGAVLMMKYAADAAKYFKNAEIIEMHHHKKKDAPSGTAQLTRDYMNMLGDVPIHSVRLPGLFAHQAVIFGSNGETLTLRHDAIDRECMMPGVLLACRKISEFSSFVIGLDSLLHT